MIKCDICERKFDPTNLVSVLIHEHDDLINPAHALGIKGFCVQKRFTNSPNVVRIGYDRKFNIMQVEFMNGKKYDYKDVPESTWLEAIQAPSIGNFLVERVKGCYRYEFTTIVIP